jgi:hypothetical protein
VTNQLPEAFVRAAYTAPTDELAWPRDWALQVIDFAGRHSIAVLGVEVWLATTPEPTIPEPYIYAWSVEPPRRSDESSQEFADRCGTEARTYIAGFAWGSGDAVNARREPYFNLVLEWPAG